VLCLYLSHALRTRPPQVFALFCKYDTAQRGCLTLANVYKMLGERKSIFGDSLFELIGKRGILDRLEMATFCCPESPYVVPMLFLLENAFVELDSARQQ